MRKLLPLVIALVAFGVVLGCGQQGETEPDAAESPSGAATATAPAAQDAETTPTPEATSPGEATPQATPQATPAAQESPSGEADNRPTGGTLHRLWADPPTLDPHLTSDTRSAGVVVEIFSGLMALTPQMELIPDLAQDWEVSEDGTVYTFHLRPDAQFHDGKPVTAQDFKWSFERAANPATGSPVAETYLGDIVGVDAVLSGEAQEISGIQVIDEHTLQITIDAPKAYFLAKMTYPTTYVLDRENVESGGGDWTQNPNGTGPFKLQEYAVGERIVLVRNDNYYRDPMPKLDQVVMNLAGGQAMAMYENDEIDITGVGLFDLERVQDPNSALNDDLVVAPPDFSVSYIGFNTSMPPFDDPKFRQALNHAVDKELIANEVLAGLREPAYGILPPGFPGYNPDLQGLRYDPEKAEQLLSESKYADPNTRPRIILTVPGTGGDINLALEVVLEMWRQNLGVNVEVQQVEWATFLQDLNQQKFQAFAGLGWEADYPDPQDFLDVLFHSDSQINHGGYSNPEVDRLLEQARVEQDVQKRMEMYQQIEQMIVQDAPWVPMWFTGDRYVLIKDRVKNYQLSPMIVPRHQYIYIEE